MAIYTANSNKPYEKKDFMAAIADVSSLEALVQGAQKPEGNWNPKIRQNLGNLLHDNPAFYSGMSPDALIQDSSEALKENNGKLQEYINKYFKKLVHKLSNLQDGDLVELINNLPLEKVKTENAELDAVINSINELKALEKAQEHGNYGEYVAKKMKNVSGWRKNASKYNMSNPQWVQQVFNSYAGAAQAEFQRVLSNEDGSGIDKNKLISLIKNAYAKLDENSKEAVQYRNIIGRVIASIYEAQNTERTEPIPAYLAPARAAA